MDEPPEDLFPPENDWQPSTPDFRTTPDDDEPESVRGLFRPREGVGYDGDEALADYSRQEPTEIPTWSGRWNDALRGGIPDGCFICVGAATGGGKTKMAVRIVDGWLKHGVRTAYVTLEPSFTDVMVELFQANSVFVRPGKSVTLHELRARRESFGWTGSLVVNDRITVTDPGVVMNYIREIVRHDGVTRVVIDFVQMVGSDTAGAGEQAAAVRRIINRLYDLTREDGATVLVQAQLGSDALSMTHRPTMKDLEWSRNIAQRSDQVMLFDPTRKEVVGSEVRGYLIHAKSRGRLWLGELPFAVNWREAKFRDAEPDEVDQWPE